MREMMELLKASLRIDFEDAQTDLHLRQSLMAAEQFVVNWLERDRRGLLAQGGGTWPAPVRQAIIVVAATLHEEPLALTSTSVQASPFLFSLLQPYRKVT